MKSLVIPESGDRKDGCEGRGQGQEGLVAGWGSIISEEGGRHQNSAGGVGMAPNHTDSGVLGPDPRPRFFPLVK